MTLQSHKYFQTVMSFEFIGRYYVILVALSSNPNLFRFMYTYVNI